MAEGRVVSRREFLKLAGVAGATVGLGAGLGGLVAACGGGTTTTTAGATTTTAAATTTTGAATTETTAPASSTTVSAAPEAGRAIKIGIVSPKTGNFSVFAISDDWWIARSKTILKDGIVTGDGKLRQFDFNVVDSQSDSNRAAQVAGDLVTNNNVDILLASGTPDTCNPVADQAEALGCPALLSFSPWQACFVRNGKQQDFKWVYGNMLGSEETIASFTDAFENSGVQTNKVVGMLFQNDADYQGWMDPSAAPKVFKEKGYTLVVPQPYAIPAEDFTKQITEMKSKGCEIVCGTNDPPWFSNFTKQSLQQNFKPKFISSGKGLIFPQAVATYPNNGIGMIGEAAWHPSWKIKDTLDPTMDSESLATDYEKATGQQWTAAIGTYGKLEWAIDVYKRAKNPEDKTSVVDAIKGTNNTFQQGTIDMTSAVDPNSMHPIANNCKAWIGAQQWRKGTKWPFEPVVVSNATAPGTTVQDKAQPMTYA